MVICMKGWILVLVMITALIPGVMAGYTFDCSPGYGCVDLGTVYINDTITILPSSELNKYCNESLGGATTWYASTDNRTAYMRGTGAGGYISINITDGNPKIPSNELIGAGWNKASATYYIDPICVPGVPAGGGSTHAYNYAMQFDFINTTEPLVADFEATPLSGSPPLPVSFTDTSTGGPLTWLWNLTYANNGTIVDSSTSQNWGKTLPVGVYTVNLTVTNSVDRSSTQKTSYITVATGAGYEPVTLDFYIRSSVDGSLIQHSSVGIYDWTAAVWRNTTDVPTGVGYFDSTGAAYEYPLVLGQTVMVAAGATGFSPQQVNVTIPYSGYAVTFNLLPTAVSPVAGNGTLQFNVVSNSDGQPINGASVIVYNETALYSQTKFTTGGGSVTFTAVPLGRFNVVVSKTAYQSASLYVIATSGTVTTTDISLVAIGATPTPTGTPVSGATAGVTPDTRTNDEITQDTVDDFMQYVPFLVPFFIIITIMGLMRKV